ncbi:MAG: spore coat associated protein CotJA [Clostridia bacterium]|nr:spore coat associated protein CotJA [Clostridia bacterium]
MENNMRLDSMSRRQKEADFEAFATFLSRSGARNEEHAKSDTGSPALAMVYPVRQDFCRLYDPEIALINGTVFEELHKPFMHSGCGSNSRNGGEGCL